MDQMEYVTIKTSFYIVKHKLSCPGQLLTCLIMNDKLVGGSRYLTDYTYYIEGILYNVYVILSVVGVV